VSLASGQPYTYKTRNPLKNCTVPQGTARDREWSRRSAKYPLALVGAIGWSATTIGAWPAIARWLTVALAAALLVPGPRATAVQPAPYVLAVHPYLSAQEVRKRFAPLAEYLGRQLRRPVQVRVGSNYEEHISFVGQDAVDFAYIGPAPYVTVVERYGPKPILARVETKGTPYLNGVVFVRQDSSMQSLADLKGKRFAFGDPESTMGSIMPRFALFEAGIRLQDLARVSHVQSHDNVVLGVLSGDFDAGVVRADIYDEMAGRGLRKIAELPRVSEHLFVARSDLPSQDVRRLRRALLQLRSTPEGQRVMHAISTEMTGLVPASDADYDGIRKILWTLAREKR